MLEKELQKKCLSILDTWQFNYKVVVHYTDLSKLGLSFNRGRYTKRINRGVLDSNVGTPDIVAYIKHNDVCAILFLELKVGNNKQSVDQLKFMMKFSSLKNVYYEVIKDDPQMIDTVIERITKYHSIQISEMTL